jgi:hypothetical protein
MGKMNPGFTVILPGDAAVGTRKEFDETVTLRRVGRNWQELNEAVSAGRDYIVILEENCTPCPGWLDSMHKVLENDKSVGAVESKMLNPDGTVYQAGLVTVDFFSLPDPIAIVPAHYGQPGDSEPVNRLRRSKFPGPGCLMIRKNVLLQAGTITPDKMGRFDAVELGIKLEKQRMTTVYQPESEVMHAKDHVKTIHPLLIDNHATSYLHNLWYPDVRVFADVEAGTIELDEENGEGFLDQEWIRYQVGQRVFGMGDIRQAEKWLEPQSPFYNIHELERHFATGLKNDLMRYRGASFLKSRGAYNDSARWFSGLLEKNVDRKLLPGIYFHLGEIHMKVENIIVAEEMFRQCLLHQPNHGKAREYLEKILDNTEQS